MESAYTELASKRASRDRRRAQKQLSLSAKQNERAGAGMLDVVMKNKFLLAKEDMKSIHVSMSLLFAAPGPLEHRKHGTFSLTQPLRQTNGVKGEVGNGGGVTGDDVIGKEGNGRRGKKGTDGGYWWRGSTDLMCWVSTAMGTTS
ncbi:hypothetical protein H257_14144 [Aphanomyces astaci]|uniref:Uncharacterized protein n=1 Tax=Aphanomyces astaci TaxID=112090 RepID=W4FUJ7_APHAT|nr:hypothetical protein H257_14144 [Aphanomyces astaci]ETV70489.1 hypothetical protein H257_14144 [Aphanomyces astaci]|eukprot:XP_009840201.1 hypothetical protein H257_14144 [Aphanomyces astaci]